MTTEKAQQTLAAARNGASHFVNATNSADSPAYDGGTTRPRSGPGSDYGNKPAGAPVETTDSLKDHVDWPGYRHLDPKSFAKRGAVDGKPASAVTRDHGDTVKDVKMPKPETTRYRLLYEQDDHGNYRSNSHSAHFNSTTMGRQENEPSGAIVDTGKRPNLDDLDGQRPPLSDEDPCGTALNDAAISCDNAGLAKNYEEREGHLSAALEHIDRACRAHKSMKSSHSVQVADTLNPGPGPMLRQA